MGRFVSDRNKVGFQFESGTYATPTGTALQWVGLVTEHNIVDTENVTQVRYLGTNTRNVDVQVDGALDHEGTITYHPQDWKMLGFALGSVVNTGSDSPTVPYTHTLSESNSGDGNAFTSGIECPFVSFTIQDSQSVNADGDEFVRTAKGCIVDSLEISASQGEQATVNVTYRAQSVAFSSGTPSAITAATTRPFRWQDFKVHLPSGTVINEVKDATFSVSNSLEVPHYMNGNRTGDAPIPLNRDYSLSLTVDSTTQRTKTLYDQYFRGGSEFNVLFEVTDASAGAGSRQLLLSLSGCRITDMESPSNNEGMNEQTITIVPETATAVVKDLIQSYNYTPF